METKIGATKIAETVVASLFPIPRHICVQNVSWSMLPYEADLLVMTPSGYLIEVETKISLSDLKRDAGKNKWRWGSQDELVSRFYYAMPAALWDKTAAKEAIRAGAGVIVIRRHDHGLGASVAVEAVKTKARKMTPKEQFNLARVGSFRAWGPLQKHRLRQLKAEHEWQKKERDARWKKRFDDFKLSQ